MRVRLVVSLTALLALGSGCMTSASLSARLHEIKRDHNVTVRADNPLSRCYLFGYLPGLLDRIDADLDRCPQHFKENLGPVIIEEGFIDNPATYPLPFLLRGYVDLADREKRFPIHIKNRSLLERVLLLAPRDGELFLHEATHSFEANVWAHEPERWARFGKRFDGAQPRAYGGTGAALAFAVLPPLAFLRPRGMPSFYG